jgi:hypothetical protein
VAASPAGGDHASGLVMVPSKRVVPGLGPIGVVRANVAEQ